MHTRSDDNEEISGNPSTYTVETDTFTIYDPDNSTQYEKAVTDYGNNLVNEIKGNF